MKTHSAAAIAAACAAALACGSAWAQSQTAGNIALEKCDESLGTLAVITQLTFKLKPIPESTALLWATFDYLRDAQANRLMVVGVAILVGDLAHVQVDAWLGVAYNVLIAFAWAHWAWIKVATSVPVSVFSLSMLVIPVLGVLSGMLLLGERPTWAEYAALALVLGSLLTVVLPARGAR